MTKISGTDDVILTGVDCNLHKFVYKCDNQNIISHLIDLSATSVSHLCHKIKCSLCLVCPISDCHSY